MSCFSHFPSSKKQTKFYRLGVYYFGSKILTTISCRVKLLLTWAFVYVAAFVNRCGASAFFTSMISRGLYSSYVCSHTSSAFLVTLTDHPVIPFTINYTIVKYKITSVLYCYRVLLNDYSWINLFLYHTGKHLSHLDILCPYTLQFPRAGQYMFLRSVLQHV